MIDPELTRRVEYLEETVDPLRDLPDRTAKLEARMGAVETQIVQLRTEMHDEFSAIRSEFKADLASLEIRTAEHFVGLRDGLRQDIAGMGRDLAGLFLESRRQTQVLIEGLITPMTMRRETSPPTS